MNIVNIKNFQNILNNNIKNINNKIIKSNAGNLRLYIVFVINIKLFS